MTTPSLKSLCIEHLRGSVQPFSLTFEKGKKLTVVYGENGTGKSTICDALDFLGNGKVGSLDGRGLGATKRYWHSIGRRPADVAVTLETVSTKCRATVGRTEVLVDPLEHRPRVEVLRRSQILSLLEAKPAERYAAISRFVDVTAIESSEAALRELIRDTKNGRGIALARLQENRDALRQFWAVAGNPGTSLLVWAEGEATRDADAFDAEIQAIGKLYGAFARLSDYPEKYAEAATNLDRARKDLAGAERTVQHCLADIAADAPEIAGLLKSAQIYLAKHVDPVVCPLCQSGEKAHGLAERVNERIIAFDALHQAIEEKDRKGKTLQHAEQQLAYLRSQARQHSDNFEQIRQTNAWTEDIALPATSAPKDIADLPSWLVDNVGLPEEWKKAEISRQDNKRFLRTLKQALTTYTENMRSQQELDTLLPKLERALEIAEEERKRFTDTTLASIAAEVGRLYEAVHPGEGLNKINLELDPAKRASLEIGASFCGHATPPQAYFSDSHLDTLGLCVFLALSAKECPETTILALDDVLGSVDEPHVDRLIEMLYDEAEKFRHCLITTHYRPWKQKLRWGWLKSGQCQFVELTQWNATKGLDLIASVPEIDRLRQLLAETPPDPQLVCAKAGVMLEAALDFLTQLYQCAVPRRPGGAYTLGDLLPSVDKKLRDALKVEVRTGEGATGVAVYETKRLAPHLNELHRIAQVRNVFGCHFNALSFELLDTDAIAFGQQVLELVCALTDHEEGWPRSDKSGSYWATKGETRRLHPLRKPS